MALLGKEKVFTCVFPPSSAQTQLGLVAPVFGVKMLLNISSPSTVHVQKVNKGSL